MTSQLDRSLTNQPPTPDQIETIESLREAAKEFGRAIETTTPSRERSLAITNLEQSLMWAVKGVVLS